MLDLHRAFYIQTAAQIRLIGDAVVLPVASLGNEIGAH